MITNYASVDQFDYARKVELMDFTELYTDRSSNSVRHTHSLLSYASRVY